MRQDTGVAVGCVCVQNVMRQDTGVAVGCVCGMCQGRALYCRAFRKCGGMMLWLLCQVLLVQREFKLKEGSVDEFRAALRSYVDVTQGFNGCFK